MKSVVVMLSLFSLVACGRGKAGKDGQSVSTPALSSSSTTGVELEDVAPGPICSMGGISIFTYKDLEANGVFDGSDTIIKAKSICNGQNGADGSSSSVTVENVISSIACPNGGVRISSTTSPAVEVCNGKDGLNGEQGIQGEQGIPGMTGPQGVPGTAGSVVTPVKLCKTDNTSHPEYGLLIGEDLYAVYFGRTPSSPNVHQSFLTKLTPGTYQSTGGNGCTFTIQ